MIVLILAALIALVARVDAAGAADDDAIELAIRYADALTGIGSDPRRAPTLDAYDELDELDEGDEVDELDEFDELDEADEANDDDTTTALRRDAREGNSDGGGDRDAIAARRSDVRDDSGDDGDAIAALRIDALEDSDDLSNDSVATTALRNDGREDGDDLGDDGDATAALRSKAREDSYERADRGDAAERPAFADDALLTIDTDRERDEDADAFASDPIDGNPVAVADLDREGDTEISEGAGVVAMLDAELDPGDAMAGGDAVVAAAPAGAAELYEQSLRHQRPSPWGRLDVGVSLRRRSSEPMHAPASRRDEVWLVATWRR